MNGFNARMHAHTYAYTLKHDIHKSHHHVNRILVNIDSAEHNQLWMGRMKYTFDSDLVPGSNNDNNNNT